jgi:hydroxymethylpyrimidine pyrophosphatase-like HAD family hydrolase
VPALRKQLQRVVTAVPTFIDGQMRGEEWLQTADGLYKADFEHHNFGGGEPDIVDPAYDLAAAIHEFRLSKSAERELLRIYISESDDSTVADRILLYKVLYGTMAMKSAANRVLAGRDPEKNNERRRYARDFVVYSMNEFCAQFVRGTGERKWSPLLFFMDLDGVFDHELLGFPHATRCGLQSIMLLRSHGFSVVPNTGRSVKHLRQYCEAYGFPGGVAEYGSVFADAVNGREVSFVDKDAADQLALCRDAIRRIPGVFIDPGYEYSIRAYRYSANGLVGLHDGEIKELLGSSGFSKLTYLPCAGDTYIVQKRISKGSAVRAVRRLVGSPDVPVAAIGDSIYDISMLAAADFAYAPSNCSPSIRELAKQRKCKVLKQRFQNGLLAAVQERLREGHLTTSIPAFGETQRQGIMETLLKAADRGPVLQGVRALMWWSV